MAKFLIIHRTIILRLPLVLSLILCLSMGYSQTGTVEISAGTKEQIPVNFRSFESGDLENHNSFWARVSIESDTTNTTVLKVGNWYMQQVNFFDATGQWIGIGNYLEVQLKRGNNIYYLYYPFADDKDNNGLTVSVLSLQDFNDEYLSMRTEQVFFAATIGMLFLLSIMYSVFIRSSDNTYIRYALYLITILIFFTYQYGILGDLFKVVNKIPPAWFWIFSDFLTITFLYFSQSFLDMKKTDPLLNRIFNFGIYMVMSMAAIEIVSYLIQVDVLHSLWFKGPFFAFQIFIFPFVFYRIYKQKTILSWLFLTSLIVVSVANLAGQLASTFKLVYATNSFLQMATLIDTFIFSIGIAIRFGIIAKDKQKIQSDLIRQLKLNKEIQEKNAAELELKVKERTKALNQRNQENELLVKEIHHRVKNNLQVISSLLSISERKVTSDSKQPFRDSVNRINSMGLIHSFLYQNNNFSNIDLEKYLSQLTGLLAESYRHKYSSIQIPVNVGSVKLDMDSAIEIGLIINELVTNSLKHGVYSDGRPVVKLNIKQEGKKVTLQVKDNGLIKESREVANSSFGMRMIAALAKKLNGELTISTHSGFEVKIVFTNP